MTRHTVRLTLHPPTPLDLAFYRRWNMTPPHSESTSLAKSLARLVPYHRRSWHRAYARANGYFWLPCPLCDQPYGGHESAGRIPDPTDDGTHSYTMWLGICGPCTRERSDQ